MPNCAPADPDQDPAVSTRSAVARYRGALIETILLALLSRDDRGVQASLDQAHQRSNVVPGHPAFLPDNEQVHDRVEVFEQDPPRDRLPREAAANVRGEVDAVSGIGVHAFRAPARCRSTLNCSARSIASARSNAGRMASFEP